MQEKPAHRRDQAPFSAPYGFTYGAGFPKLQEVRSQSVLALYERYHGVLWDEGSHKYNVAAFIREIDAILESASLSTISQTTIDFVIGELRKRGNSNATINRKMAALRKLLRKAQKMGDIHSLPEFRRQKERQGRIRFLEIEEEDALFSAIRAHSEEYYRLSCFLVDTGARLGEALGLRWNDIYQDRVTFWITKSGRSRSVPLTRRAALAVTASKRKGAGPFAEIAPHKYRQVWNEAKASMGLTDDPDVVPHVLRHTCASRLVRGGIDLRRVQMWLGHQTLAMTMRYAHLATHDLDMCVAVLERTDG